MTLPADVYPRVMHVIDLLGQAKTESEACDTAGITVHAFRNYVSHTPELHDLFLDAEQRGYDRTADELANIHKWGDENGVTDVRMLSLISKNRWHLLSKRRPQQYGDKVVHEHNITADRTIIEALSQGKQRALAGRVIEDVVYAITSETVRVQGVDLDVELLEFIG